MHTPARAEAERRKMLDLEVEVAMDTGYALNEQDGENRDEQDEQVPHLIADLGDYLTDEADEHMDQQEQHMEDESDA